MILRSNWFANWLYGTIITRNRRLFDQKSQQNENMFILLWFPNTSLLIFLKSDVAVVSKELKKFFWFFFGPAFFVFFASLIRFLCLRILVGFRRSSLVGPHRIPSASKELRKFFFRTRFVLFSLHPWSDFFASESPLGLDGAPSLGHIVYPQQCFSRSMYWSFFQEGGLSERRAQPRLSSRLFLFTCNMRSCKRYCCARFRRFDLLSTLLANSQRWRVGFVSRSIVFAEAFMFHRLRLVSTLVLLVYYVTKLCHVSLCSPASSLLLFSHLSQSFLLTPHCCRDLWVFFEIFDFCSFLTIFLLAPLACDQKTGFSKNRFSTEKILIFLILINKKKKAGRGFAAAEF